MTVTLTYDSNLARVRVDATALAAADVATIERSVDQIQWTVCRGGSAWPCTAGAFDLTFDDYEFEDGVPNYYRVRGIETAAITFLGAGTAATGNNASVVPTLPAGLVEGDLMVCFASIRNSGTGTVNIPAVEAQGWEVIWSFGTTEGVQRNGTLFGRRYVSGDVAPTISFSGGVANADTLARIEAWRSAGLSPVTGIDQLNASAQDVAYPALTIPQDGMLIIDGLWKQDDFSATPSGRPEFISGGNWVSTAGDDAGMAMYYQIQTDATNLASGSHTVTGGAAAISRSVTVALAHAEFLNEQTNSITPDLDGVWLKSLRFPFLNRKVNVLDYSDIQRQDNNGVFHVLGRTLPVAVTDARGSREWTMTVWTETAGDAADLDTVLASGDLEFIHVPADCTVPGGYVVVGTTTERKTRPHAVRRHFDLPVTEVAAPKQDSMGSTATWQTVLDNYATWADLIADKATWADVLELIGSADEVIVP